MDSQVMQPKGRGLRLAKECRRGLLEATRDARTNAPRERRGRDFKVDQPQTEVREIEREKIIKKNSL